MKPSRHICDSLKDTIQDTFIRGASDREFVSKERITRLVTKDLIESVLLCSCYTCQYQRGDKVRQDVKGILEWIIGSSQQLFALLAYNGCAQLIDRFFEKDYNDGGIIWNIQQFNAEYISCSFWPDLKSKCPAYSNRLAKQVTSQKHQFFPPIIRPCDSINIQRFDAEAVIPIIKDDPIDQGGFGDVTEFQLLNEYNVLQTDYTNFPLVRKEVDLRRPYDPSEELDILLRVKNLEDDHIIKLVTAYECGNKMNYIFPKATTNLRKFLRDEHAFFQSNIFTIEKNPLWEQILAVFRVIFRLHNDVYQLSSGARVKVYHFDMKPDNILVDVAEGQIRFIVNDFGFSRHQIAVSRAVTSAIVAFGGTFSYAPPEVRIGQTRNHRYDVWSLGCILLEVCAFVVGGCDGVKQLDDIRYTDESLTVNQEYHDYFWHITAAHELEIKPAVVQWMQSISQHENVRSGATSNFLQRIMDLAMAMLNVDVSRRLDAETAQARLCSILQKVSAERSSISSISMSRMSDDLSGIVPIGEHELESLKLVNCKYGGRFYDKVKIRFYEDPGGLHLQLLGASNALTDIFLGQMNSVLLTPSPCNESVNKIELHLTSMTDPRLKTIVVHLPSPKDTAVLQSVFLGYKARSFGSSTRKFLAVKTVAIEQKQKRGIQHIRTSIAKTSICSKYWEQPRAIQIWYEKSYHDADALERFRPRRRPSFRTIDIPSRKIAIHFERALMLIPFAKNVRLATPPEKYTGFRHEFIPTDQSKSSRDPTFEVIVVPADSSRLCKVPVDREGLAKLQQHFGCECTRLEIEFTSRQDWDDFWRTYRALKREWSLENADLTKQLAIGGEQRGWSISM